MQRSEGANNFESNSLSGTQTGWRTATAGGPGTLRCLSAERSDSEGSHLANRYRGTLRFISFHSPPTLQLACPLGILRQATEPQSPSPRLVQ